MHRGEKDREKTVKTNMVKTDYLRPLFRTAPTYSHFGRLLKSCDIIMASNDILPRFPILSNQVIAQENLHHLNRFWTLPSYNDFI